jgi:hypothetical protein
MGSLHHYLDDDHPEVTAARQEVNLASQRLHHASELLNELDPDLSVPDEITLHVAVATAAAQVARARAALLSVDRLDDVGEMLDSVSFGVYHYADSGVVAYTKELK